MGTILSGGLNSCNQHFTFFTPLASIPGSPIPEIFIGGKRYDHIA